ncbi:MAG: putative porin, partial [Rhodothermales bacterium]
LIPEISAARVTTSNTLNLVAEIRVRDAKLFLVYDNVLAGTSFLPGNFLVPIYPLPAQRFRFGIYWPILG